MHSSGPIGVFDSGYGGLTILRELRRVLPRYDYLYLGDNARAPYGTRDFETVYQYTLQAVRALFARGCPLVILACNTASAKALRTIQQRDLPVMDDPSRRVLGVIRPTAEAVGHISKNGHIGVFATPGTIASGSYDIEIRNLNPGATVTGHACPEWVPLVEQGMAHSTQAAYAVRREVEAIMHRDPAIDTLILGCTHYPLLHHHIQECLPPGVELVSQGAIVAGSLKDYLERHPEMQSRLSCGATAKFLTTGNPTAFNALATVFAGHNVVSEHAEL